MTRPPGRISSLTGLRGVAIALVLAAHAHVPHLGVGLFGVDVFFVLSGFLITHVLLELAPFGRREWGRFLGRRAARLLPALAVTLVGLAGWVLLAGVEGGGRCLMLASTHTMDLPVADAGLCPGPLHITWSLAAEEQFYLLWPLAVLLLSRLPRAVAGGAALSLYAGCWALSARIAFHDDVMAGWWNYSPGGRPAALLLGAGLAFLVPLHARRARPLPRAVDLAAPLLLAGLVTTGLLLSSPDAPRQVLLGPLVAVPAALVVAGLVTAPSGLAGALCRHRTLVWLGEVSYCLYLVHDLLLHVARDLLADDAVTTNALGAGAAVVAAAVLHRYVEQPARSWGYAWLARRDLARMSLPAPTLVG